MSSKVSRSAPFRKIYITSCYHMDRSNEPMGHRIPVIDPLLVQLGRQCQQEGAQWILLSDTNAHSPMWHMPRTNARGKQFEEFITDSHLHVLNQGPREHNWTWQGLRGGGSKAYNYRRSILHPRNGILCVRMEGKEWGSD